MLDSVKQLQHDFPPLYCTHFGKSLISNNFIVIIKWPGFYPNY